MQFNFRVWDIAQKQMVYFNFSDIRRAQFFNEPSHQYVWPEDALLKPARITETLNPVMRGSGLNDVNGKEIFEGDILEGDGVKEEVVHFDAAFWTECLSGEDAIIGETALLCAFGGSSWRIIGNIHENP